MRRASSLQDQSLRKRPQNVNTSYGDQRNASWDLPSSQQQRLSASASRALLFETGRRGSNGMIPGQQLSALPLPPFNKQPNPQTMTFTQQLLQQQSQQQQQQLDQHDPALNHRVGLKRLRGSRIYDDPAVIVGYNSVPLIELDRLPRGGISLETKAIGRIQFGIPPETIKDSMRQGYPVPSAYIVPVERFCREMGPALGINLAEFEFPAYFNYFVFGKRCTLLVDSLEAEDCIRRVFAETLLGPAQFRDHSAPKPNEDEDFDPSYPIAARPNFYKEFYHFRTAEKSTNYQELSIDTLLEFCHFKGTQQGHSSSFHDKLGVPPVPKEPTTTDDSEETSAEKPVNRRHTFLTTEGDDSFEMSQQSAFHLPEEPTVDSTICADEEEKLDASSHHSLRRTMSDPDMRRASLDDLMQGIPLNAGLDQPLAPPSDSRHSSSAAGTHVRRAGRRGSLESTGSFVSKGAKSRDGMSWVSGASFMLASDDEEDPSRNSWMYSQAKWLGDVATIYPSSATEEQKRTNSCARVEIFKMTGGTEYIVHDVDENNTIVGKARFSGTVRVPDEIAVEGFLNRDNDGGFSYDNEDDDEFAEEVGDTGNLKLRYGHRRIAPPTFHPPSFGVTVLGNSHGFDKNGSVSGYVLWINGRGVMIDPPPYSSATLEREGIRPQMIMAIMITHCHADHDAGTFQKVMTGSRVAIITTPTIYKSFIRKYAALSGLSPTLLRHSHRHRPAIVGQPLKFQGATFTFTYTLHTIPCIAFKVEWRGRSMVFTGDHLNCPEMISKLESQGVLTPERANALRQMPLQECDALLHEAGAPPIHTPLKVLSELPDEVKKRLYVVHTSALPPGSDLRVAPTGTAGTIRLDLLKKEGHPPLGAHHPINGLKGIESVPEAGGGNNDDTAEETSSIASLESPFDQSTPATTTSQFTDYRRYGYGYQDEYPAHQGSASNIWERDGQKRKQMFQPGTLPPMVFLRPTCVSDAWFILNLLSNVPFLSSLSYANTMEVLEIAMVEMFCPNEIVIPAHRRSEVLCVVWEGTCVERDVLNESNLDGRHPPLIEHHMSMTDLDLGKLVYLQEGENALYVERSTVWHAGDWTGPISLQPDEERSAEIVDGEESKDIVALSTEGVKVIMLNMKDLNLILKGGSKLYRKYLSLKEKQASKEEKMKSLMIQNEVELGQLSSHTGHRMEYRFDTVAEQNAIHLDSYGSVLEVLKNNSALGKLTALQKRHLESLAEGPRLFEPGQYLWQVGETVDYAFLIVTGTATFAQKPEDEAWRNRRGSTGNMPYSARQVPHGRRRLVETVQHIEEDKQLYNVPPNSEYARLEIGLQLRVEEMELDGYDHNKDLLPKEERVRNARDRFANKVLARLYSRRAYTAGLVFSRGHLLSDTSRMVSGNLAHIHHSGKQEHIGNNSQTLAGDHHCHTSNMVPGPDGCVVMVFPRSSLVQFLDGNPGVLLSLLGTQVVV